LLSEITPFKKPLLNRSIRVSIPFNMFLLLPLVVACNVGCSSDYLMIKMKSISHLRSLIFCLFILVVWAQGEPTWAGEDLLQGPWDSPAYRVLLHKDTETSRNTSMSSPFFISLLNFFSAVISPVDGDRCPSYPTCAAYSKEAYRKHGAFLGTLMTVDRLFHEADESRFSPTVEVYGVLRIYDPVSANEFWKRQDKSRAEAKSIPPEK
jgi:hypothetical protein